MGGFEEFWSGRGVWSGKEFRGGLGARSQFREMLENYSHGRIAPRVWQRNELIGRFAVLNSRALRLRDLS